MRTTALAVLATAACATDEAPHLTQAQLEALPDAVQMLDVTSLVTADFDGVAVASVRRCPEGFEFSMDDDGVVSCMTYGVELPGGDWVDPICDRIDNGYIGFAFPASDYDCPSSSQYAQIDEETAVCLWSDFEVPEDAAIEARCRGFERAGVIGYSYSH